MTPILVPFVFIIEKLLNLALKITTSGGIAAVLLSAFVMLILLPVYYLLERWQQKDKAQTLGLEAELEKIKKVKNSQERYFYTKELYRQYHYSPLSSLKGLIGLAIQIPFFIAAYSVLRKADGFAGASFLAIKDLASPDKLLFGINILPLLMTAVNIWGSVFVYKFAKKQELLQQIIVALVFLVLLYAQPAFLVLYWLMNNVFSLLRQMLFQKMFKQKDEANLAPKTVCGTDSAAKTDGFFQKMGALAQKVLAFVSKPIVVTGVQLCLGFVVFAWVMLVLGGWREPFFFFPLAKLSFAYSFFNAVLLSVVFFKNTYDESVANSRSPLPTKSLIQMMLSLLCTLFEFQLLCLLVYPVVPDVNTYRLHMVGFAVASAHAALLVLFMYKNDVVAQLKTVFQNKSNLDTKTSLLIAIALFAFLAAVPLQLIFSNITDVAILLSEIVPQLLVLPLCVFAIFALVGIFAKDKRIGSSIGLFLLITGILSWKGTNKGFLFKSFLLEDESILKPSVLQSITESLWIYAVAAAIIYTFFFAKGKLKNIIKYVRYCSVLLLVFVCVDTASVYTKNAQKIALHSESLQMTDNAKPNVLSLSKNKNAIVFYLDCASSNVFNEILQKEPSIRQQLADFTWYKDAVSLGACTELGAPAMFGGEEFAPSLYLHNQKVYDNTPNLYAKAIEKFITQNVDQNRSISFSGERMKVFYPKMNTPLYSNNQTYVPFSSERKKNYYKNTFFPLNLVSMTPRLFKNKVYYRFKQGIVTTAKNTDIFNSHKVVDDLPLYELDMVNTDEHILVFYSLVTHGPYGIDKNFNVISDIFSGFDSCEGAYNATYFALSKISEFTESLKQHGLYDSAQIVIIADHGLPNNQKALTVDEAEKLNKFTTAYDSLLLVKERNSKTEFAENNDVFVTNADLQTIIEEGFKGNKFTDVIPPLRTFYYALQVQAHQPVKEYGVIKMNGTSLDTENWEIIEDYTP